MSSTKCPVPSSLNGLLTHNLTTFYGLLGYFSLIIKYPSMKKLLLPLLLLISVFSHSQGLLKKASGLLNKAKGGNLSTEEVVAGLKEALSVGANKGADKLSAEVRC